MLIVQKFLQESIDKITAPIPDRQGLFGYSLFDELQNSENFYFVYYAWESGKSHPGQYVFKHYTLSAKPNNTASYLIKNIHYHGWCDFFTILENIKFIISQHKKSQVCASPDDMQHMIWRAFLKTQDASLAAVFANLPESFFQSIDNNISVEERLTAQENFLGYLQDKYFVIYNAWIYFFEVKPEEKYCPWFYNYIYG